MNAIFPELPPGDGTLDATVKTTIGNFTMALFDKHHPRAVKNFVGLVTGAQPWKKQPESMHKAPGADGSIVKGHNFYKGLAFHYVKRGFHAQFGCPWGIGSAGPDYCFENEINAASPVADFPAGTIAYANRMNQLGSQCFVVTRTTPWLVGHHTPFGLVTSGLEVVRRISEADLGPNFRPFTDILIDDILIERRA